MNIELNNVEVKILQGLLLNIINEDDFFYQDNVRTIINIAWYLNAINDEEKWNLINQISEE